MPHIDNALLQSIAGVNTVPLLILCLLLFFLRSNWRYEVKQTALFKPPTLLYMMLVILDNLDYYAFDGLEHVGAVEFLHRCVSMLAFDVRLLCMGFLMSIVSVRIGKSEHTRMLTVMPAVINVALLLPTLFTDWYFYYAPDGTLVRNVLFYEPHIFFVAYWIYLIAIAIVCWHKYNRKVEGGLLIILALFVFVAVLVEMLFALKGILIGAVSLSILGYYLYVHVEHFRYDTLTHLLNRDAFKVDTDRRYSTLDITHILSIDLNNLKKLNDTYGHEKGDIALKSLAKALDENKLPNVRVYRIGGDEFAAVCVKKTTEEVENMIHKMLDAVEASGYSAAIGYSEWKPEMTFLEVYKSADDNMYHNKRVMKGLEMAPMRIK